ncbi:MAG: hypothetical protein ACE5IH_00380 [Thermodesulfobacteriota bacterium]
MRKFLFYFLLFYLLQHFIKKALIGPSGKAKYQNHPSPQEEDMVLDPSCDTYISKATALTEKRGGNVHYFCSEECRKKFLDMV